MADDPSTAEDSAVQPESKLSCHGCRRRKLRCSREQPSCSNCVKLGLPCVYDVKKGKPGLKVGAVEGLARRLDTLEKAFSDQQKPTTSVNETSNGQVISQLAENVTALATAIESLTRKIDSEPQRQNVQTVQDGPAAAIDARSDTLEISTKRTLDGAKDDDSTLKPKRQRIETHTGDNAKSNTQSIPVTQHLGSCFGQGQHRYVHEALPDALVNDVIKLYFMRTHCWIPILHWNRFKLRFRRPEDRKRLRVVLDAMVVAALKLVDRNKYDLSDSDIRKLCFQSRNSVILSSMSTLSVEAAQALIIVAFADMGNGCASQTWSLIGSLSRTVEYLQLSVEEDGVKNRRCVPPLSLLTRPRDWTEEEERRRVFWNVFLLDRFCSITTGWNTSLTADDVSRRLPVDGINWYLETPVSTPYFGIWDKSAAKMENSVAALPSIASRPTVPDIRATSPPTTTQTRMGETPPPPGPQSVGGLAYLIEATESLNRIATYFLRQNVNFHDEREVAVWLTRFKELDLRLVHWKMFLPTRWRNPNQAPDTSTGPSYHDHGTTLAHVTHNTSIIILHAHMAYSIPSWCGLGQLPSTCSAETCRLSAIEITHITEQYLKICPGGLVGPQFAFCIFVSAKSLLVHSRHFNLSLSSEFSSLVRILQKMAARWEGLAQYDRISCDNQAGKYAERLLLLHEKCKREPGLIPELLDYSEDTSRTDDDETIDVERSDVEVHLEGNGQNTTSGDNGKARRLSIDWAKRPFFIDLLSPTVDDPISTNTEPSIPRRTFPVLGSPDSSQGQHQDMMAIEPNNPFSSMGGSTGDLASISQSFMDQTFADMDRIIGFSDSFFLDVQVPGDVPANPDLSSGWPDDTRNQENYQGCRSAG